MENIKSLYSGRFMGFTSITAWSDKVVFISKHYIDMKTGMAFDYDFRFDNVNRKLIRYIYKHADYIKYENSMDLSHAGFRKDYR